MPSPFYRLVLAPEAGDPSGGAADNPTPPDNGKVDVEAAYQKLLEKHRNDGVALSRVLFNDAYKARRRAEAAEAKAPPEGSLVLSADDAKAWAEYRKYGDPSSLGKALDDGKAAISERATMARERLIARVAKVAGFDPDVFARAVKDSDDFEVVEEKGKDGKAVEVARVKGADDKPVSVEEHYKVFLSSLRPAPEPARGTPAGPRTPPAPPIVPAAPARVRSLL